jgi:hypothetical protein
LLIRPVGWDSQAPRGSDDGEHSSRTQASAVMRVGCTEGNVDMEQAIQEVVMLEQIIAEVNDDVRFLNLRKRESSVAYHQSNWMERQCSIRLTIWSVCSLAGCSSCAIPISPIRNIDRMISSYSSRRTHWAV